MNPTSLERSTAREIAEEMYQAQHDEIVDELETRVLEGLRRGEEDIRNGRVTPIEIVEERLRKKIFGN